MGKRAAAAGQAIDKHIRMIQNEIDPEDIYSRLFNIEKELRRISVELKGVDLQVRTFVSPCGAMEGSAFYIGRAYHHYLDCTGKSRLLIHGEDGMIISPAEMRLANIPDGKRLITDRGKKPHI